MARHDPEDLNRPTRIKGRGAGSNREGRFEELTKTLEDDGWYREGEGAPRPPTHVSLERARSIISRNDSPDIPFTQSINPYRGCEHGCNYCYARPSHAYLNLSPGLDFETQLFAKTNAAERLRVELAKPGYVCEPITLGANTDCYQPIEREYRITREIIEVLHECRHPLTIVTKNALVERDLDLLAPMARDNLVQVFVSLGNLDNRLASTLEPRATAPHRRMQVIANMTAAGVPCGVLVAPIIPAVTDMHIEHVLEQAAANGANIAGYTVLRLPLELKELFREWLDLHVPERAEHVMSLIRQMRGGRDYDARFGARMRGEGPYADLIRQRFALACRKHGLGRSRDLSLDTALFIPPRPDSPQGSLF
ncbi:PA0069 family radical SAM protein [Dokdonella immobilis]|uniref:DNA repair photolyase n=1 Tax=Dokdonella immobilis TaxID=578942 RepID=A0A1I4Y705_9GAMM|nr:PA0069 family radical SAM protein [Dokdonella immobilis]SFN33868.1 DNA repair photolyase [Dokdonella immobilis]